VLQLDAARTWNFVLPEAWTTQPAPIRLTATITAPEAQSECYPCHDKANSLTLSGLTFNTTAPLRLNVVYGCVRRKAGDPQSACDTAPLDTHTALFAGGDSLVVQTFPLAAVDFQISLRSPITLPVDGDPYYDGAMTPERVADFQRMVCALAAQHDGDQAPPNEITVGLLPGPTMGMLGKGRPHCITVVVEVEKGSPAKALPRAAELVAEELGHALGRPHAGCKVHVNPEGAPCEPTYQQFPCPHGGICTPGFDTYGLRAIDPGDPPEGEHAHDFMSYGDGAQWISPYTYRHLYDALRALAH
jgi:hypothetical protein